MAIFMNSNKISTAYLVVRDIVFDNEAGRFEDERIYGILKLQIEGIDYIEMLFFNEQSEIDLSARFVTRAEWETMEAFKMFPVLKPFDTQVTLEQELNSRKTFMAAEYKVRFRDY